MICSFFDKLLLELLSLSIISSSSNLFMDLERTEDEMEAGAEDMKMSLEDVQELMEELELDLLK